MQALTTVVEGLVHFPTCDFYAEPPKTLSMRYQLLLLVQYLAGYLWVEEHLRRQCLHSECFDVLYSVLR